VAGIHRPALVALPRWHWPFCGIASGRPTPQKPLEFTKKTAIVGGFLGPRSLLPVAPRFDRPGPKPGRFRVGDCAGILPKARPFPDSDLTIELGPGAIPCLFLVFAFSGDSAKCARFSGFIPAPDAVIGLFN